MQVFLAHANEDKTAVLDLYDHLQQQGYTPWLDKKDLIPGQNWKEEIPKAIRASDIVIACLSARSVNKRGYVQQEFKLALMEYAQRPPGTIYFIPLKLDPCEMPDLQQAEYGVSLRDLHWLDYWEEDGFEQLVRAIEFQRGKLGLTEPQSELVPEPEPMPNLVSFEVVTVNPQGQIIQRQQRQAEHRSEDLGEGVLLELAKIPTGTFWMSSPVGEEGRDWYQNFNASLVNVESPQHQVTVPSFWMGKYPVTQAQWQRVASFPQVERELNPAPAYFKGANRPVEQVSWWEAIEFCARLSRHTRQDYRLPSEAEWEYACRAGTSTPFNFGETITTDLANYRGTDWTFREKTYSGSYSLGPHGIYRKETTEVGRFSPNGCGLHDMHGNVWEWCLDHWHNDYQGAPTDGSAWLSENDNDYHVIRGGSWYDLPWYCRSAYRDFNNPHTRYYYFGLRLSCGLPRSP